MLEGQPRGLCHPAKPTLGRASFLCVADTFWSVHMSLLMQGWDLCICACTSVFAHNPEVRVCVLGVHCSCGKHLHVGQFGAGWFEGTPMLPLP